MARRGAGSMVLLGAAGLGLALALAPGHTLRAARAFHPRQDTTVCRAARGRLPRLEVPGFTPFSRAPELRNREEVRQAIAALYPAPFRNAGVGGATTIWLRVDECGGVAHAQVKETSGYSALDLAALRVAGQMRFTPGYLRDQAVPVWITIPIVFRASGAAGATVPPPGVAPGTGRGVPPDLPPGANGRVPPLDLPTCDALEAPLLACEQRLGDRLAPAGIRRLSFRNAAYIESLLRAYAPGLKQAHGEGTAVVRVAVDASGHATEVTVARSSGRQPLDLAALAVARALSFFPPRDTLGRYSSVTLLVPVRF